MPVPATGVEGCLEHTTDEFAADESEDAETPVPIRTRGRRLRFMHPHEWEEEEEREAAAKASSTRFEAVAAVRSTKYGRCPQHGRALQPHLLWHGQHRGHLVAMCPLFYQRPGSSRKCWHKRLMHRQEIQNVSKGWQQVYGSLKARLLRGGCEADSRRGR